MRPEMAYQQRVEAQGSVIPGEHLQGPQPGRGGTWAECLVLILRD